MGSEQNFLLHNYSLILLSTLWNAEKEFKNSIQYKITYKDLSMPYLEAQKITVEDESNSILVRFVMTETFCKFK